MTARAILDQVADDVTSFGVGALLIEADGSVHYVRPEEIPLQPDRPSEGPAGGQPPAGGEQPARPS